MVILIMNEAYLPGWKMGGPVRSLSALVEALGDEFHFKVVTRDRDFKEKQSYPDLEPDRWHRVGKADVLYLSPKNLTLRSLQKVISEAAPQVLYLNSFFSPCFTIKPLVLRWLKRIPQTGVVLAPRGELSQGAMSLKSLKKHLFLALAKSMGLYDKVTWHATSDPECADISRRMKSSQVVLAPVLSSLSTEAAGPLRQQAPKAPGQLKAVFLSRVSRMKNLTRALQVLQGLSGNFEFNIYGPIEDAQYWSECEKIIRTLPPNIRVSYKGTVLPDRVVSVLQEHHLFLFPTLNENFGHVIAEAFAAGCLVLTSNNTPWRNLADKGVGWDLPLDRFDLFQDALRECLQLGQAAFDARSARARLMVRDCTNVDELGERYRRKFRAARTETQ